MKNKVINRIVRSGLFVIGLLVLIVSGVEIGIVVASHTSLLDRFRIHTTHAENLQNKTTLRIGDPLPFSDIMTGDHTKLALENIIKGKRVVIGIVAEGCGPCQLFIDQMKKEEVFRRNDYDFILLSHDPDYFREMYDVESYYVEPEELKKYSIDLSPTVFGVNSDSNIAFISSGYNPGVNSKFILNCM
ncbi:MAG: hypothetical protein R3F48_12480 [Candidatus Zixiibacteriota bacterium]